MGAWGQFWSLVWKNYVIRKRHPSFVVLEVVWPVLMFVALALFRLGFPPDHRETCQFQERALPSAGMIPFLQTSICQLQNNCSNQAWKEERETAQANFQQLIGGVTPILEKESTVQAFKALPKMNKVLKALQNFSKETSLDEIDEALKLKNMFKDPARVIDIIANKYGILSPKMAEYLLESTLNPVAIMEMLGSLDMKKVVCDPAELTKYLLLSPKVNKYSLSDQLCRINDALISNITNELVRQLDVAKVIKLGQDLMKATGSLDVAMLLGDIANLVERFLDDSSILSMFMQSQAIPDLSALPLALHSVSKLLPLLMNIQGNELESVRKMIDVVSPPSGSHSTRQNHGSRTPEVNERINRYSQYRWYPR
ncbi:retinal-specific phospholipid-transporting ATPase ABCA4-like [Dreissena polymorpha]|uniref:retinal-specific phospholipid-transporting ATPase ABCA4-like n=1 Tax=Dreissena polymorpha TaxID=45954 RepID=UPI0022647A11|nr:retinal-specific phospholipid-transporting ATPase ABCA4-like [Dreissena polymorpha]